MCVESIAQGGTEGAEGIVGAKRLECTGGGMEALQDLFESFMGQGLKLEGGDICHFHVRGGSTAFSEGNHHRSGPCVLEVHIGRVEKRRAGKARGERDGQEIDRCWEDLNPEVRYFGDDRSAFHTGEENHRFNLKFTV